MRYEDCRRADGYCELCEYACSGSTDCRGDEINRIMFYRQRAGLSLAELARRSQISARHIERMEFRINLYRDCKAYIAASIAEALGVSVGALLEPDPRLMREERM